LRSRVVFGGANVNKYALLFQSKNSVIQQLWKNVPFKTRWPFWNVFEDSSIENVDTSVNQSVGVCVRLFRETANPPLGSDLDCPVSLLILGPKNGHAGDAAGLSMEANQPAEIRLHERVAIHHQKIGNIPEKWLREFHGPRSTKWERFPRIFNLYIPNISVAQLTLDFVSQITSAHHYSADTLEAKLAH
jgi:hypothetical protein